MPEVAQNKWWKNPQGIVASATIAAMVLGFFYVREKQMWEQSTRIQSNEDRGTVAIAQTIARFERIEQTLTQFKDMSNAADSGMRDQFNTTVSQMRDQINYLERKIDHADTEIKYLKERQNPQ